MHARELSKRLHKQGLHHVSANSLHPGVVNSNLSRHTPLLMTPIRQLSAPFRWLFLKTDRDGAQTSLYLALSKKVDGISGKYFNKRLHKQGLHHVSANSLHPGAVNSNLSRHTPLLMTPIRQLSAPFRWLFLKTDRDGAQTSLYLALSKKVDGISGKYFK
ncbi:unnamed protein product [Strongylus vulgaris]|uniref:Uncharacterized protein n=1 Tax=Strongylus vulgaris TaxID=40348 RepID=A0A3P7LVF5_STRVU|nr:unnamed protein product [Strongylus vulgaris]